MHLAAEAGRIGWPVLIKAAAGGGGKGMRVVHAPGAFRAAAEGAAREAEAAFGDPTIFLEKYLTGPRHVEFQIIGDTQGTVLHLGERECSIQRRHQKVLEEAPTPAPQLTPARLAAMGQAAVRAGEAAGYVNAGTVEFIVDASGGFYLLEMNTRLQVEHPITEATIHVPGAPGGGPEPLDLVALQLRVAEGCALPFAQPDVTRHGHAIEVRVYAEDPAHGFLPSTGRLQTFAPPHAPWVRNDAGVAAGDAVSIYYDPMLAKLIVAAPDRPSAVARLAEALAAYDVTGVTTNLGFLFWLAQHPAFREGATDTGFIDRYYDPAVLAEAAPPPEAALAVAAYDLLHGGKADATLGASRPFNPWRAGAWQQAGQDLVFRYHFLPPGLSAVAAREPAHLVEVRFDRATEAGVWQTTTGDYSARLSLQAVPEAGVLLRRLDGPAPGALPVRVTAPADGRRVVEWDGALYRFARVPPLNTDWLGVAAHAGEDRLDAPMPGKIVEVLVAEGDHVAEGQRLVVMEAMKMEFTVRAPHDGRVARLTVRPGQLVEAGTELVDVVE